MYFASDGHPGLGGLDVFVMDLSSNWNHYRKLRDINSTQDDFSFVIDAENKKSLSLQQRGGLGSDDIYRFNKFPVPVCNQALQGVIKDQDTGLVLANAKVSLFDSNFNLIKVQLHHRDYTLRLNVEKRIIYVEKTRMKKRIRL
jgi:hypothetical protein